MYLLNIVIIHFSMSMLNDLLICFNTELLFFHDSVAFISKLSFPLFKVLLDFFYCSKTKGTQMLHLLICCLDNFFYSLISISLVFGKIIEF